MSELELPKPPGGKESRLYSRSFLKNWIDPNSGEDDLLKRLRDSLHNVFVQTERSKKMPLEPVETLNGVVTELANRKTVTTLIEDMNHMLAVELKQMCGSVVGSVSASDSVFLARLNEIWSEYACEILPWFQAIFLPVQEALASRSNPNQDGCEMTVERIGIAGFRDFVILSRGVKEKLSQSLFSEANEVPPRLQQMIGLLCRTLTKDQNERELLEVFDAYLQTCVPKVWKHANSQK